MVGDQNLQRKKPQNSKNEEHVFNMEQLGLFQCKSGIHFSWRLSASCLLYVWMGPCVCCMRAHSQGKGLRVCLVGVEHRWGKGRARRSLTSWSRGGAFTSQEVCPECGFTFISVLPLTSGLHACTFTANIWLARLYIHSQHMYVVMVQEGAGKASGENLYYPRAELGKLRLFLQTESYCSMTVLFFIFPGAVLPRGVECYAVEPTGSTGPYICIFQVFRKKIARLNSGDRKQPVSSVLNQPCSRHKGQRSTVTSNSRIHAYSTRKGLRSSVFLLSKQYGRVTDLGWRCGNSSCPWLPCLLF